MADSDLKSELLKFAIGDRRIEIVNDQPPIRSLENVFFNFHLQYDNAFSFKAFCLEYGACFSDNKSKFLENFDNTYLNWMENKPKMVTLLILAPKEKLLMVKPQSGSKNWSVPLVSVTRSEPVAIAVRQTLRASFGLNIQERPLSCSEVHMKTGSRHVMMFRINKSSPPSSAGKRKRNSRSPADSVALNWEWKDFGMVAEIDASCLELVSDLKKKKGQLKPLSVNWCD